jgi:hypothetical protein
MAGDKKALLRAMIKLKQLQDTKAQAAGQDVVNIIQEINKAEKIDQGSSITMFKGMDTQWKSNLLKVIKLKVDGANISDHNTLSRILANWATTTKSAKAGRKDYILVLGTVL